MWENAMKCLSKIEHTAIPNDIVVSLSRIYRHIGNNDNYVMLWIFKMGFYICHPD